MAEMDPAKDGEDGRSKGASPVSVLDFIEDDEVSEEAIPSGGAIFLPEVEMPSTDSSQQSHERKKENNHRERSSNRKSRSSDRRARSSNRRERNVEKKKRALQSLPFDEASSCVSGDTAVAHNRRRQKSYVDAESDSEDIEIMQEPHLDHEDIKIFKERASQLALRGNEQRAIKIYKRALKLTRNEMARLKRQLQLVNSKSPKGRGRSENAIYGEWIHVALVGADIQMMMAIIYERAGDYERAIACCNEVRDLYEQQSKHERENNQQWSSSSIHVGQTKSMIRKMEIARDSLPERDKLHGEALKIHQQIEATKDVAIKDLLYEDIFDKLSAVLTLELDSLGDSHPQVAKTMSFLGKIYLERGEIDKALDSTERAAVISELALGVLHPRTAEKYRELGRIYDSLPQSSSNSENAIIYYEKAIETYLESDGDHSKVVGSTLNDVAVLHTQQGNFSVAIQKLKSSLESYASVEGKNEGVFTDTVQVWKNLGECYFLRTEYERSITSFRTALEIQCEGRKAHDAEKKLSGLRKPMPPLVEDENIAHTLKRLGMTYAAFGRYKKAISTLEEALAICNALHANSKRQRPADTIAKQDEVAQIKFHLAEANVEAEEYDQAALYFAESFRLRLIGIKQRNQTEDRVKYLVQCAQSLAGLGSVRMRQHDFGEAHKVFDEALQFAKEEGT